MIITALISALILIESREIFQGLLSQPFVTAVLLIFAGYDQHAVLSAAVLIQLLYLNKTPSGTTFHPEYPFGFFITAAVFDPQNVNAAYFAFLILVIISISLLTGRFIAFKRDIFEIFRTRFLLLKGYPDIFKAFLYSFSLFFIFALVTAIILNAVSVLTSSIPVFKEQIPHTAEIIILLCLIPAVVYAAKNIRIKA